MITLTKWRVLLIGGSSGTGKTTAARTLARRFNMAWCQADDLRLVLQRETTPEQRPDLHFFLSTPGVWNLPPEELCQQLVAVGRVVSHAIEVVVAHHLSTPYPLIVEGDGILPAMAAQASFAGTPAGGQLKSVFLFEPDEDKILSSMRGRGRGLAEVPSEEQANQARMSQLYGRWLLEEAQQYGLPVITTRPWRSLAKRIVGALGGPP